jgi:putative transposase
LPPSAIIPDIYFLYMIGIWLEPTRSGQVLAEGYDEIKKPGLQDIYSDCVERLKGFPDAKKTIFHRNEVQFCIVHIIRNTLRFVFWKDRKNVIDSLKAFYQAATEEQVRIRLGEFAQQWDTTRYLTSSKSWTANWQCLFTFFA